MFSTSRQHVRFAANSGNNSGRIQELIGAAGFLVAFAVYVLMNIP